MTKDLSELQEPRCIRIFKTEAEVERAKKILQSAGYACRIREDGFGTLKLKDLGMTSRFRLYVERKDIDEIGTYLAKKMKEKKLSS